MFEYKNWACAREVDRERFPETQDDKSQETVALMAEGWKMSEAIQPQHVIEVIQYCALDHQLLS